MLLLDGECVDGTAGWRVCLWYFNMDSVMIVLQSGEYLVGTEGWKMC